MKRIIAAAFASFIAISAAVSSLCALAKSEEDISPALDWLRRNEDERGQALSERRRCN